MISRVYDHRAQIYHDMAWNGAPVAEVRANESRRAEVIDFIVSDVFCSSMFLEPASQELAEVHVIMDQKEQTI